MDLKSTCEELKAQLSDYVEGALNPGLCAELERHLADCDNCRIVVNTLGKTILLYRNYGVAAMPDGARERLIKTLRL